MTDDENRSARMSRRRKLISRRDAPEDSHFPEHVEARLDAITGRGLADMPADFEASHEIDVLELLANRREVVIVHCGNRYRLRITTANKLILTK